MQGTADEPAAVVLQCCKRIWLSKSLIECKKKHGNGSYRKYVTKHNYLIRFTSIWNGKVDFVYLKCVDSISQL